jgi:hypothetical protein
VGGSCSAVQTEELADRDSGLTGAALTVTGALTGMTVAAVPAGVTGHTSMPTISAGQSGKTDSSTLTVRGNAPAVAEKTVTLTVTVTSAGGGAPATSRGSSVLCPGSRSGSQRRTPTAAGRR